MLPATRVARAAPPRPVSHQRRQGGRIRLTARGFPRPAFAPGSPRDEFAEATHRRRMSGLPARQARRRAQIVSDAALALLQPPRENSVLVACPLLIEAQLLRHHGTASSGNHPTSARTATPFQQARRPPTSPPSVATVA